jgi:hypothetical protein
VADVVICPAVSSFGTPCELPVHHNSAHGTKDETLTWEPRYVAELRHELEDAPWMWKSLLKGVLEDLGDAVGSESIDEAREALKRA